MLQVILLFSGLQIFQVKDHKLNWKTNIRKDGGL